MAMRRNLQALARLLWLTSIVCLGVGLLSDGVLLIFRATGCTQFVGFGLVRNFEDLIIISLLFPLVALGLTFSVNSRSIPTEHHVLMRSSAFEIYRLPLFGSILLSDLLFVLPTLPIRLTPTPTRSSVGHGCPGA